MSSKKTEIVTVSRESRWLAALAGFFTAPCFPVLGIIVMVSSLCLIAGALTARRFPRNGRDLIWFGAGVLSLFGLPLGVLMLRRVYLFDGTDWRVPIYAAASILVVVSCDVTLVIEALKARRARLLREDTLEPNSV
jgi:tetrahydromethanopterin S-methyltransferase subunit C